MEWKSIMKLLGMDFTVIRTSDHPQPQILKATEAKAWVAIESFSTKAERNKAVNNMLEEYEEVILDD